MNSNGHDKFLRTTQIHLNSVHDRQKNRLKLDSRDDSSDMNVPSSLLKRAQSRFHEKHYSEHYDFAPIGLLTLTNTGLIKELNIKVCGLLGLSRREVVGRSFTDFLIESERPSFLDRLQEALSRSHSITIPCTLVKNGENKSLSKSASTLSVELECLRWRDDNQGVTEIRCSLQDVSRWMARENELKLARDKALADSQAKSQFLANMSHEMRTPLGVMIGFTELLREDLVSDEIATGLETIHRNGRHLLNLVDDLLDLAKIEAGQLTLESLSFDVQKEMQSIVDQFCPKAREKGIDLSIDFLTTLPDFILTDPIRFRQVILNIISNALKFTTEGFIRIEVSLKDHLICVDVIDSGGGISEDQAAKLFKPFVQADAATPRRFGGTGLGLCLSRSIAEAMGGGVTLLKSIKGEGSTFRITVDSGLSLAPESHEPEPDSSSEFRELPSLEGIRILVVEDGIDNQVLIKKLLENVGAEVQCAEDGLIAIDRVMAEPYDVILMDIQLPVMDGYTTTTQLRNSGCNLPIIALTAHALVEDRIRAEEGGFDDFISKPIDWYKLTQSIVRCHEASFFH